MSDEKQKNQPKTSGSNLEKSPQNLSTKPVEPKITTTQNPQIVIRSTGDKEKEKG
jgi:hypothetical protein